MPNFQANLAKLSTIQESNDKGLESAPYSSITFMSMNPVIVITIAILTSTTLTLDFKQSP